MIIATPPRSPAASLLLAVTALVSAAAAPGSESTLDGTPMDTAHLLPERLGAWRAAGDPVLYDRDTVFRYMDGAAEVYLSFAFQSLLVGRYGGPGGHEVTVELYDMGNPADAFMTENDRHRRPRIIPFPDMNVRAAHPCRVNVGQDFTRRKRRNLELPDHQWFAELPQNRRSCLHSFSSLR